MLNTMQAIVLAAGKATRFKTDKTKLIEKICGQEIILYTTKMLAKLNIATTVVVGFQKESIIPLIQEHHGDTINFVEQQTQQGTGHALATSENFWHKKLILVLNSDAPLITTEIIEQLYAHHLKTDAMVSFVTAHHNEPFSSYGRVVTDEDGIRIIEANEFKGDAQEHCCINAGIYLINRLFLQEHITHIKQNNLSKEFYITDLIGIASARGKKVSTINVALDLVRGVNTLQELWAVEQIKRSEIIKHWMNLGVRFMAAQNIHLDLNVTIGTGTTIGSGTHLIGHTTIGKDCDIQPFSLIEDSTIEDHVTVQSFCIIKNTHLAKSSTIGPFAHVQEATTIGRHAVVGNFVEIKRTTLGAHSKVKHLSYLGDAIVGENANIGAGTITCNYDGIQKQTTVIADNAHIGSNNCLIAPVVIGARATTGAGSVITNDVPEDALAIARTPQTNKLAYTRKLCENKKPTTNSTPFI